MKRMKKRRRLLSAVLMALILLLSMSGCGEMNLGMSEPSFDLDSIPEYSGKSYVIINDNVPDFTVEDLSTASYEH